MSPRESNPTTRPDPISSQPLSREEINALPLLRYKGKVHVVDQPHQVAPATAALNEESLLGFDLEARPAFKKGESHPPALLQLAGEEAVWLFRLNLVGLPRELRRVLENVDIKKVGVAMDRDVIELRQLKEFEPGGFIELSTLTTRVGIESNGLRGLVAQVLGRRLSKRARLINWAANKLTPQQITYAATDAWVGRAIYERLSERNLIDADATPVVQQQSQPPKGKSGSNKKRPA